MTHLLSAAFLVGAASAALAASAAIPFDGTWVTRVDTISVTGQPDRYLLANGMFTCGMCYPGLTVKADGRPHPVVGHAYYDTVSASALDDRSVKVSTWLKGKPVDDHTITVTSDGTQMTLAFQMHDVASGSSGKVVYARVAPVPAGAHAISGSWQTLTKDTTYSPDLLAVTFSSIPNGVKMLAPTGRSYEAKFDGHYYSMHGDQAGTTVMVKRLGANGIVANYCRSNQFSNQLTYIVSPDGKTLSAVEEDKLRKTVVRYSAWRK